MSTSPQDGYRWATITPDNYSGALYVVAFLSFTYTSTAVLARVLIKINMLGIDDNTMVVAQGANIVQFALLISSLSSGLVRSYNTISSDQYSHMAKTLLAGQIAIYLALGLSKMATVLIVRRLFTPTMKEPRRVCNIVLGVVILWTVASVILVSAGCSAASISPKTPFETCPSITIRYLVVTITDALTDILLTITPAYLCRRLNMKIWFKLQGLGIFALRLPLIMLSILFFKWWKRSFSDANPGIARMTPLIYQQCQLCMSIIVGTIPSLKGFLQSFDTGSGIKAGLRYASTSSGYPSEWSSASLRHELVSSGPLKSYRMERLNVGRRCVLRQHKNDDNGTVWVNETPYFEEVHRASMGDTGKRGRSSSRESDRRSHRSTQGLFIWKDMEWKVTRETALRESDTS